MKLPSRACTKEDGFWNARNFLREIFLLNGSVEHSWHVARLDYWRWHFIKTCNIFESFENGMAIWENANGRIIAALNHLGDSELRLQIHPHFRSAELENEMLAYGEENFFSLTKDGRRYVFMPIFEDDTLRQEIAQTRGYQKRPGWGHHYRRNLDSSIPNAPLSAGYTIRSMGGAEDYPSRSWHPGKPSTIMSQTKTTAVTVLVGTAIEHWRRGLGKAVITAGLRRLKALGCKYVFSIAHEKPVDFLYRSVLQEMKVTDTWVKLMPKE